MGDKGWGICLQQIRYSVGSGIPGYDRLKGALNRFLVHTETSGMGNVWVGSARTFRALLYVVMVVLNPL